MSKYQWIKTVVATASMFVFSVTLANTDSMTTASTNSNPYTYADSVSSAANPSYTSVGQPVQNEANSLTLNNQALGLGGPVSVTGGYSADYGYELQASFSHMIGLYDAISLLGAYAPQENRIDITWAHAWTEKQRTKLSVERLSEDMDFNYDSGSATEWVPQYSFGAGYQYLFNQNWLRNIELSGYYAQAQSQDLDTVRFESNGVTYDNYRHIAGAISQGTEATLNISPWKTGLLGLGLNYDSVNYDTKYEDTDAQDSKGFGFTLSLEQLLSKHVKLNFEGSQREVYDNYVAGVSFLTPSNLEVGFNGERTLGENGSSSDSRFNMSLAYFLDDHDRYQHGYSLEDVSQSDLASWASKSPAYMDEVIAAADQKTVVVVNSSPTPPQSTLQSTNNMPVISLTAGEINHVDISDYIASSSLTDAQKQAIPTIIGGPSDVEFTYDNATQSLNTKAEVPASAVNQTSAPLVLRFPADTTTLTTKVATTSEDQLSFSVTVGDSITPYLNSGFNQNLTAVQTHAQTWVLKYENVASPATSPQDSATMFINPNSAAKYLQIPSVTDTKYFQKSGDTNNCYATPIANNTQDASGQTLTLSSKAASNCPDNVTYKVKACNTSACSASFQTINITVQPATSPYIMGGAVPNLMESSSYSYAIPNSGDTGPMASPGEGQTFQSAQLKVFNATGGCVDVTNDSNLELNMGTNQLTLQTKTGTSVPSSLVGDNLKIYMSITNNLGNTFDNGTTSNCQGDPWEKHAVRSISKGSARI